MVKVVHAEFRHPEGVDDHDPRYTNDQNAARFAAQGPAPRARGGESNMIPTTTGAAKAIGLVMPELKGKTRRLRDARADAQRVGRGPGRAGRRRPRTEEVNAALKAAANGPLRGIMQFEEAPLVSIDFRRNPHSSIVDAAYTKVMDGDFVKVLAWYDNEWGYSTRCVDLLKMLL